MLVPVGVLEGPSGLCGYVLAARMILGGALLATQCGHAVLC